MLFLDIETKVADGSLICVGWAVDDDPVETSPQVPAAVVSRLADVNEVLVTHSGFDERHLRLNGAVSEVLATRHDTMVMAWLCNENMPLGLADLMKQYCGVLLDKSHQKLAGVEPYDATAAYCAGDVRALRDLYHKLVRRLQLEGLWDYFDQTGAPLTGVLRDMETRGLPVDLEATAALAEDLQQKSDIVATFLKTGLPSRFNLRSPAQVSLFLSASSWELKDKLPRTEERDLEVGLDTIVGDNHPTNFGDFVTEKRGRLYDHGYWLLRGLGLGALGSVSRPALVPYYNVPWVKDYLTFKQLDKLLGTYLYTFPVRAKDGRIYGRFNQTGTVTGRLSSSEPNLQNIPSRGELGGAVRKVFTGNLIVGDFSQLEPRLMAHFSQDPAMLAVFEHGGDIYADIASAVGCTRTVAKTLVLAMGYGAGADRIANTAAVQGTHLTLAEARALLIELRRHYETYFEWRDAVIARSTKAGFVETLDGRRRRIPARWTWRDKAAPGRQAANAVVQGSAADVVARVMLHVGRMFPELRLLAQVHDELVWEYDPPLAADTLDRLQGWVLRIAERGLSVPLVFEPHVGPNWFDAKEGTEAAPAWADSEDDDDAA